MAFAAGKLGKLMFIFYPKSELPGLGIPYTPMYNPTKFTVSHKINYDCTELPVTSDVSSKFISNGPRSVSMQLMFDSTGASPSGLTSLASQLGISPLDGTGIDLQLAVFLKLGAKVSGGMHQPFYIMMVWGTFIMTAVLSSANVSYNLFDRDGRPLRATLDITLDEHIDNTLITKLLGLASPDLSKSITVKEGDTLPLLCKQEYGDPSLYIEVAEVNNLDNYRKLKPGMQLLFPPIKSDI